jgi:hypothetical protein
MVIGEGKSDWVESYLWNFALLQQLWGNIVWAPIRECTVKAILQPGTPHICNFTVEPSRSGRVNCSRSKSHFKSPWIVPRACMYTMPREMSRRHRNIRFKPRGWKPFIQFQASLCHCFNVPLSQTSIIIDVCIEGPSVLPLYSSEAVEDVLTCVNNAFRTIDSSRTWYSSS